MKCGQTTANDLTADQLSNHLLRDRRLYGWPTMICCGINVAYFRHSCKMFRIYFSKFFVGGGFPCGFLERGQPPEMVRESMPETMGLERSESGSGLANDNCQM